MLMLTLDFKLYPNDFSSFFYLPPLILILAPAVRAASGILG